MEVEFKYGLTSLIYVDTAGAYIDIWKKFAAPRSAERVAQARFGNYLNATPGPNVAKSQERKRLEAVFDA